MHDTKKGRYTEEENERIISALNDGLSKGKHEREIIKELSLELNRGYAGVMSHIRKLRIEMPDRFTAEENGMGKSGGRLNSWTEEEEKLVIDTVNQFSKAGNPLSAAISVLEKKLPRTQGAIYQRIYTLRNKHPELFFKKPLPRPRRRQRLEDWQVKPPLLRTPGEDRTGEQQAQQTTEQALQETAITETFSHMSTVPNYTVYGDYDTEVGLVLKAFENRYGRTDGSTRQKLMRLIQLYGSTRVSIAMFTAPEDKDFPRMMAHFLERHLEKKQSL